MYLLYSMNSTNEIIVRERPDLSWSLNSTSVQTVEICGSIRSPKNPTRPTVPHLTVTIVMWSAFFLHLDDVDVYHY
jgi:hypothetical protein